MRLTIAETDFWISMLIRRIYQVANKCDRATSAKQFRFVMRILAESGLLYLSIMIAHLVAWFTKDYVAIQVLSTIVSIDRFSVPTQSTNCWDVMIRLYL